MFSTVSCAMRTFWKGALFFSCSMGTSQNPELPLVIYHLWHLISYICSCSPFQSLIAFYVTRDLRMNEYSKAIVSSFTPLLLELFSIFWGKIKLLSEAPTTVMRITTFALLFSSPLWLCLQIPAIIFCCSFFVSIVLQVQIQHLHKQEQLQTCCTALQNSVFPILAHPSLELPACNTGDQVEQPAPQIPPYRRRDTLGHLRRRRLRPPERDAQPHVPSRHGHRRRQRARHGKNIGA